MLPIALHDAVVSGDPSLLQLLLAYGATSYLGHPRAMMTQVRFKTQAFPVLVDEKNGYNIDKIIAYYTFIKELVSNTHTPVLMNFIIFLDR